MNFKHTFTPSKDSNGYGYSAFIDENNKLVIYESWPHEGGETYRGRFVDLPAYYMDELKVKAPSLFNSITRYYGEHIFPEEKELISRISEMCKDIAEAPTGGVDENFNIRPLKDQFSDLFIRILAGHLVANGWVKEDR